MLDDAVTECSWCMKKTSYRGKDHKFLTFRLDLSVGGILWGRQFLSDFSLYFLQFTQITQTSSYKGLGLQCSETTQPNGRKEHTLKSIPFFCGCFFFLEALGPAIVSKLQFFTDQETETINLNRRRAAVFNNPLGTCSSHFRFTLRSSFLIKWVQEWNRVWAGDNKGGGNGRKPLTVELPAATAEAEAARAATLMNGPLDRVYVSRWFSTRTQFVKPTPTRFCFCPEGESNYIKSQLFKFFFQIESHH